MEDEWIDVASTDMADLKKEKDFIDSSNKAEDFAAIVKLESWMNNLNLKDDEQDQRKDQEKEEEQFIKAAIDDDESLKEQVVKSILGKIAPKEIKIKIKEEQLEKVKKIVYGVQQLLEEKKKNCEELLKELGAEKQQILDHELPYFPSYTPLFCPQIPSRGIEIGVPGYSNNMLPRLEIGVPGYSNNMLSRPQIPSFGIDTGVPGYSNNIKSVANASNIPPQNQRVQQQELRILRQEPQRIQRNQNAHQNFLVLREQQFQKLQWQQQQLDRQIRTRFSSRFNDLKDSNMYLQTRHWRQQSWRELQHQLQLQLRRQQQSPPTPTAATSNSYSNGDDDISVHSEPAYQAVKDSEFGI